MFKGQSSALTDSIGCSTFIPLTERWAVDASIVKCGLQLPCFALKVVVLDTNACVFVCL